VNVSQVVFSMQVDSPSGDAAAAAPKPSQVIGPLVALSVPLDGAAP
jgi:hypothetical protein